MKEVRLKCDNCPFENVDCSNGAFYECHEDVPNPKSYIDATGKKRIISEGI
jgi:hypothetical protein